MGKIPFTGYSTASSVTKLNIMFSVTNYDCFAQILIVKCGVVSPTLNDNPTLFV